ncbi:MAG: toll/interleukin-1 receptor domain-containing protein [Acidimicrobiia bacterium]
MTIRVFISYRRGDTKHFAGRLRDHLAHRFGDDNVFFDVYSIDLGSDFRAAIREQLAAVDAVILMIGPQFNTSGLANEHDYVRLELLEALEQDKHIVPVLVEDAQMPSSRELPSELEPLSYRHAALLRPDPDFRGDVGRLISSLERVAAQATTGTRGSEKTPAKTQLALPGKQASMAKNNAAASNPSAGPSPTSVPTTSHRTSSLRHAALPRVLEVGSAPNSMALSPNGATLAISDLYGVSLYDLITGASTWRKSSHDLCRTPYSGAQLLPAGPVAFSPDGALLAFGHGYNPSRYFGTSLGFVSLLEIATGDIVRELQGVIRDFLAFSPNGVHLAVRTASGVSLWKWDTDAVDRTLTGNASCITFSPNGAILAGGSMDKMVRLWDVDTGALRTLIGHQKRVNSVAFSPDGVFLASGSSDKTVGLWDVDSGALLATLIGHQKRINAVAFSPDGAFLASGSSDRTVRLWAVEDHELIDTIQERRTVEAIAFSPDGALLATAGTMSFLESNTVALWSLSRLEQ